MQRIPSFRSFSTERFFQFSWSLIATSGPSHSLPHSRPLSILLESYCNEAWNHLYTASGMSFNSPGVLLQRGKACPPGLEAETFQFSWSLIATIIVEASRIMSTVLSILLESYCNADALHELQRRRSLSILLESYCNTPVNASEQNGTYTFNSPGVLLQLDGGNGHGEGRNDLSILLESYCNRVHPTRERY